MFIFTNRWTYIRMNLCVHVCVPVSCVAHVAEPQGVGELLASNWNCRFNILNYRLANGQYFVTTLPAPPPLPYCLSPPLPLLCLELPQTVTCTHQIVPHKLYCNKQSITLCVFPALDSHQFSSLPLLQLGRGNFSRECDCLVFDCLQKLFIVLLLLFLLLIVLEIVILVYSYMWDSLYGSNCLEVSTTETLRGFRRCSK